MPQHVACPSNDELRRFILGTLPEAQALLLDGHLLGCDVCGRVADTLEAKDTFTEALRAPSQVSQREVEHVEALIERLQVLPGPLPLTDPSHATPEVVSRENKDTAGPEDLSHSTDLAEIQQLIAPPEHVGDIGQLGTFRLIRVLGLGGMGVVFEAEDTQLQRRVALKTMHPARAWSHSSRARFLREAQAIAAIEHEHIVPIFQVGEERGLLYLTMPLLRGQTLDQRLAGAGQLPVSETVRIGREIAVGLAAAHDRGLIHRDIKPSNIWLETLTGDTPTNDRVRILDFGLARAADESAPLTQEGAIAGTPGYLAPEQAEGKPIDPRCDLFSLGCVLYRMATGQPPFSGKTSLAALRALAAETPRPARDLNPALPAPMADLIHALLAPSPTDRPPSAKAVVEALPDIEAAKSSPDATTPGTGPRPPKFANWRKATLLLAAPLIVSGAWFLLARDTIDWFGRPYKTDAPAVSAVPIDKLGADDIPATEQFPWKPKELVKVTGSHAWRHSGTIRYWESPTVFFSPNGKKAFVLTRIGHAGERILYQDAATGECLASLEFPGATGAAIARRGKVVAFLRRKSSNWSWHILDQEQNRERCVVRGKGSTHDTATFTDDGRLLITTNLPKEAIVWDTLTGQQILTVPADASGLIAFSGDNRRLAIGQNRKEGENSSCGVDLWDLSTKKKLASYRSPIYGRSLALSGNGEMLALAASDSRTTLQGVCVWKTESGRSNVRPFWFNKNLSWVRLRFSPDGNELAGLNKTGGVSLVHVGTGKERIFVGNPTTRYSSGAYSPDGRKLALATTDGAIEIWDPVTGQKPAGPDAPPYRLVRLGPRPNTLLVTRHDPRELMLLDTTTSREQLVAKLPQGREFGNVVMTADGKTIAAVVPTGAPFDRHSSEPFVGIWDSSTTVLRSVSRVHDGNGRVLLSPDEKLLFVPGLDRFTWQRILIATGERQTTYTVPYCLAADWYPEKSTLALTTPSEIKLLDTTSGAWQKSLAEKGTRLLAFSPDGRRMAFTQQTSADCWLVRLFDLPSRTESARFKFRADDLKFSSDRSSVLFSGSDGRVVQWFPKEKWTREWSVPAAVNKIFESHDGRYLYTGNQDGTIYVFRLAKKNGP